MKLIITLSLIIISLFGFSQERINPSNKKDKIAQLKIAFITNELNFSEAEAKLFWPIYNEMISEVLILKKKQRKTRSDLTTNNYNDSELKSKSINLFNNEIKEIQLRKGYHEKIGNIIGYTKATKLLNLEQRFKRQLLNKLNEKKGSEGRKSSRTRP